MQNLHCKYFPKWGVPHHAGRGYRLDLYSCFENRGFYEVFSPRIEQTMVIVRGL